MLTSERYRKLKPVEIGPVLSVIDRLGFVNSGGECAWVTDPESTAPEELLALVRGLRLGGTYKRVFCRKLMPHQGIPPHVDEWVPEGWRRFQVPLTSHPDIKMRWPDDGVEVHLAPGWLWEVDFRRRHEVVNPTGSERTHIQIDQDGATI